MLIKDIAMFLPRGIVSTILKTIRTDIDKVGKEQILKNGLYHITTDEETTQLILDSGYLKPSTGILKNINSYGTAVACMFNGTPTIENYIKNLETTKASNNPLITPNMVLNGIKISPTEMSELVNYKARSLADDVIIYEGYCVLPKEKVQTVKLVPDLNRDAVTNEPIVNPKTGEYEIIFREAQEEELSQDKKTYEAKEDYLKYVETVKKKIGYLEGNHLPSKAINAFITLMYQGRIEGDMTKKYSKNIFKHIKNAIKRWKTPKLDMSTDEKIYTEIREFNNKKKNPYRDRKFGLAVADFQKQGLEQLELKDELEKITTGEIGKFFRRKNQQIDKTNIIQRGIHGIHHNDRVAMLSMMIARNEGILEDDTDHRTKDILLMAAYEHDIGRKVGKMTFNIGPHAKRSARKLRKIDVKYLNGQPYTEQDKNILRAVVEAHEGKDEAMDQICKKYHISEENLKYAKKLMTILKDADALDRVRLDYNTGIVITDLNPKYLRTNTAKRLLNASYQLEGLTNKVSFDKILAYKTEEQAEGESRTKAYRRLLKFIPTQNKLIISEENNRTMNKEKKKYDWEQEQ